MMLELTHLEYAKLNGLTETVYTDELGKRHTVTYYGFAKAGDLSESMQNAANVGVRVAGLGNYKAMFVQHKIENGGVSNASTILVLQHGEDNGYPDAVGIQKALEGKEAKLRSEGAQQRRFKVKHESVGNDGITAFLREEGDGIIAAEVPSRLCFDKPENVAMIDVHDEERPVVLMQSVNQCINRIADRKADILKSASAIF